MTYEELQAAIIAKQREIDAACQEQYKLNWQYIQERLPFPFRKYQRIILVTEVTEESRELMTEEWKAVCPLSRLSLLHDRQHKTLFPR